VKRGEGADHPDTLATRHNLSYGRGESGDAVGAAAYELVLADQPRADPFQEGR
jgi:hypothetical protein